MIFEGKTVFVTGGSGFIGGRLIETLVLDHGARVKALLNNVNSGALRMARYPVEFIKVPITDTDALIQATEGCDIIFHLAYGKSGNRETDHSITVNGTSALAQAALINKIERFVYVGTAAVYFKNGDGLIDETASRSAWGWSYVDQKLEAEELVLKLYREKELPASIVQVAGVYGPWGNVFTITPIQQLKTGRVVLPGNGEGISNATYVDDTVQAILLAALKDAAVGERFLIKGPGTITRYEFYQAYRKMLGYGEIITMTNSQIRQEKKKQSIQALLKLAPTALNSLARDPSIKSAIRQSPFFPVAKRLQPMLKKNLKKNNQLPSIQPGVNTNTSESKPLIFPPDFYLDYQAAKLSFSTEKAEKLLGYSPKFSLKDGMKLTEEWAMWARLIP